MGIKVITRHAIANYGSLLQSLATIKILNSFGYDTEIIDYISKRETILGNTITYSNNFSDNKIKRLIFRMVKFPDQFIKTQKFKKYRKKYIKQTKRYNSFEELKNDDFTNDILCSGSDQLWGYMPYNEIDKTYFLEFVPQESKCFAFSASFGRVDFDEEFLASLNDLLKKYNFITIREQSGVKLIKEQTSLNSDFVLDPTLMAGRDFWLNFASKKIKQKDYILVYQLRKNKNIDKYVKELSKKEGLKVIRVSTSIYDIVRFGKKKILKSPDYVLGIFNNAKYVVTDSFHATVFSLIFNKKFIDFLPSKTHERITDLLDLLGLRERAASFNEDDFDRVSQPIDYDKVNQILEQERAKSLAIIENNLKIMEKC